ncbi:MAG: pirin family protein [Candidatus Moraniibacteriota bacterium]|nr:MAG: pirin family protein [Candidatus Moranbacteria bacterium]
MDTRLFPATERGHITWDWLDTYHSFSFGHFYNPDLMGFGALRVVNDDTIAPGQGFGQHPHSDMEIITIPLSGAVEHEDNTGAHGITPAGSVQVMSAGRHVAHSEKNASATEPLSLFQIWIEPKNYGIEPRYEEKTFDPKDRESVWQLLVSGDGRSGSLPIHQDAFISLGRFGSDAPFNYTLRQSGNAVFVMIVEGQATISEHALGRRDALGISDTISFDGVMQRDGEIMIIEIPY